MAANAPGDPRTGRWLAPVIRGYFAYHAVPTNFPALSAFRYHARATGRVTSRWGCARRSPAYGAAFCLWRS
jgi:hypothetical protein